MKLVYVANVRMPTEKAHGVAIAKACEAFANAGVDVELVIPRRRTPIEKTIFEAYDIKKNFSVRFLPTIDLISEKSGRATFWLQTLTFQLSVFFYLLMRSRVSVLYTRDPSLIPLKLLGYKLIYECHHIQKNKIFFTVARMARRVIVISMALKQAFIAEGFSDKDILVAPSGVDLSTFDISISKEAARNQLNLPQDAYIAVYTGSFTTMGNDKGLSDVIKALPVTPHVLFVAVGGAEKDQAQYNAQAKDLDVADRVVLRGPTSQKELAVYQKGADVLVMPFPDMPHYRNHMSPVKMFEYMAAKRPIIATDLPTIREVLNDDNAVIVPPGDTESLSRVLQASEHEPGLRALTERAYADVHAFSWDARTQKVLKHIQ